MTKKYKKINRKYVLALIDHAQMIVLRIKLILLTLLWVMKLLDNKDNKFQLILYQKTIFILIYKQNSFKC